MYSMNRFSRCLLLLAALGLGACAHPLVAINGGGRVHLSSLATVPPPFRIPLRMHWRANYPPVPALPPHYTTWNDVYNWQAFLLSKHYAISVDNDFEDQTLLMTQKFQNDNGLPTTGMVDPATFCKAVSLGMPNYQTIPPCVCP